MVSVFCLLPLTIPAQSLLVDASFDVGAGFDRAVVTLAPQADGTAIVGGLFGTVQGVARPSLAKLDASGRLVSTFDAQIVPAAIEGGVFAVQPTATGLYIGGAFSSVRGQARAGLARLTADGQLDSSFSPGWGAGSAVSALAEDAEGRVYAAGAIMLAGRTRPARVVRLLPSGAVDATFNLPDSIFDATLPNPAIHALTLDAHGRLLVGGELRVSRENFPAFGLGPGLGLVRLLPPGELDPAFVPSNLSGYPTRVVVQSDGRLLLSGAVGNSMLRTTGRLHPDGSLDADFLPLIDNPNADRNADAILPLPSGHILVGGNFTRIEGTPRNALALLRSDGALSPIVVAGGDPDGAVVDAALTANGTILVAGNFTRLGGVAAVRVARLRFVPGPAAIATIRGPRAGLTG